MPYSQQHHGGAVARCLLRTGSVHRRSRAMRVPDVPLLQRPGTSGTLGCHHWHIVLAPVQAGNMCARHQRFCIELQILCRLDRGEWR